MHNLEQTGRTTRMVQEAERLAKTGRAVYLVFATPGHAYQELQKFGADKAVNLGVSFEHLGGLNTLDLAQMRLVGAHSNCVVLVDHHAIELRFGPVLEMLHRFDEVCND